LDTADARIRDAYLDCAIYLYASKQMLRTDLEVAEADF